MAAPPPAAAASSSPSEAAGRPLVEVTPHSEWSEAILYFIVLDRFADGDPSNNHGVDRNAKGTFHGGDLAGLRQQLDELADLGVTALWITPVVQNIEGFVTGAGFPDWGYHGYWAEDFYRLDRRFGTEEELKALVEACHARGIKLLLDVVYNHAGYESRYTKEKRDWLRIEGQGGCGSDDITGCVAGLPDFKTELPEVRDYLIEASIALAERVGLDGFRLDTVKHVAHDFWQEHRRLTRERLGEDFFLIGEVWAGDAKNLDPWFAGDEMDAGFDFSFQGNAVSFVQGRGRPVAFNRYLEKRTEARAGYLLSHFLSNHDVPGALYQLGGDRQLFRLAALLQMVSNGIPQIYYGEEVGREGGDWPENRSDMPWGERAVEPGAGDPRDESLRDFYKRLIEIRRAHPALWRGTYEGLAFEQDLLVFARRDPKSDAAPVVVAINRAADVVEARFETPDGWSGATVRDLLSDETFAVGDSVAIPVPPRTGRILALAQNS
ncbi:MAG: alpha-amylase family glycosyl hydrolase [Acidobacteriota bacterium]